MGARFTSFLIHLLEEDMIFFSPIYSPLFLYNFMSFCVRLRRR